MPKRKDELLDAATEYLTRHGLADLSLRPLAAGIGTSARLLIFHFGSRQALLQAVLDRAHAQFAAAFETLGDAAPTRRSEPLLQRFWRAATDAAHLPRLRLFYEAYFIALQNPRAHGRWLRRSSRDWLARIAPHLPPPLRSPAVATLCAAVFDGLVIELLSTGDRRRTGQALQRFVAMLQGERDRRTPRRGRRRS